MTRLTASDFAASFGASERELPLRALALMAQPGFGYRTLNIAERDQALLQCLLETDAVSSRRAGPARRRVWQIGWMENLQLLRNTGFDVAATAPAYLHRHAPLRLNGEFILPDNPDFERRWFKVLQEWLFSTYLADVSAIYEFGCGPGFNLATLATLFPNKPLVGLDWAPSAVNCVQELAQARGWPISASVFDMFAPDVGLTLPRASAVLTVHSLEQLGTSYHAFLRFIIEQSPAICVHVEPLVEYYDDRSLIDYTALRYHRQRNYLDGFLTDLRGLQRSGAIRILAERRCRFGSQFHEAYSFVVWQPRPQVEVPT